MENENDEENEKVWNAVEADMMLAKFVMLILTCVEETFQTTFEEFLKQELKDC